MFLPIGDTPNPRGFRPWVTWFIIAANVAVYVLLTLPLSLSPVDPLDPALPAFLRAVAPDLSYPTLREILARTDAWQLFAFKYGYKPGAPRLLDLFACMFMHGGFWHLAGNMLFLWIFGDNVEHRLGRLLYLVTYLVTGVIATISFSMLAGHSMVPLVGASGAISGVLGLYFLLFPRNRVKVFVALFPFLVDVWLVPVRWVLSLLVIVDNLLPLLLGESTGIAYGAHLGGFVAGLGIAWFGERLSWRLPWSHKAIEERQLQKKRHMIPAGSSDLARVYLALGLIDLDRGQLASAYQYLMRVFDHSPDEDTAEAARQALSRIEVFTRRLR